MSWTPERRAAGRKPSRAGCLILTLWQIGIAPAESGFIRPLALVLKVQQGEQGTTSLISVIKLFVLPSHPWSLKPEVDW